MVKYLLLLPDLLSAFDLVDHEKLLKYLEVSFGLGNVVLKWFIDYLTNKIFFIKCECEKPRLHSPVGVHKVMLLDYSC